MNRFDLTKSTRVFRKDRKKIVIIDGCFTPEEIETISTRLATSKYIKAERDNPNIDIRQWVLVDLSRKYMDFISEKISPLIKKHFSNQKLRLYRTYCNNISYGDVNFTHSDCDAKSSDLTVLIYANHIWESVWGGETLFYLDQKDVAIAVQPIPGRVALFHGSIPHRAGVPSRMCYQPRFTVAFKYANVTTRKTQ